MVRSIRIRIKSGNLSFKANNRTFESKSIKIIPKERNAGIHAFTVSSLYENISK